MQCAIRIGLASMQQWEERAARFPELLHVGQKRKAQDGTPEEGCGDSVQVVQHACLAIAGNISPSRQRPKLRRYALPCSCHFSASPEQDHGNPGIDLSAPRSLLRLVTTWRQTSKTRPRMALPLSLLSPAARSWPPPRRPRVCVRSACATSYEPCADCRSQMK